LKTRLLRDGREVPETDNAVKLVIHTKCPQKWMLIDLETGEHYIGHEDPQAGPSNWKKLERKNA
jgi:hypothetical protein